MLRCLGLTADELIFAAAVAGQDHIGGVPGYGLRGAIAELGKLRRRGLADARSLITAITNVGVLPPRLSNLRDPAETAAARSSRLARETNEFMEEKEKCKREALALLNAVNAGSRLRAPLEVPPQPDYQSELMKFLLVPCRHRLLQRYMDYRDGVPRKALSHSDWLIQQRRRNEKFSRLKVKKKSEAKGFRVPIRNDFEVLQSCMHESEHSR